MRRGQETEGHVLVLRVHFKGCVPCKLIPLVSAVVHLAQQMLVEERVKHRWAFHLLTGEQENGKERHIVPSELGNTNTVVRVSLAALSLLEGLHGVEPDTLVDQRLQKPADDHRVSKETGTITWARQTRRSAKSRYCRNALSSVFKIESEERCVVLHLVDQASLQSFDRIPVLVLGRLDEILASTFAVYGHAIYQIRIRRIVPHGFHGELVCRQPRGNLLRCLGLGSCL